MTKVAVVVVVVGVVNTCKRFFYSFFCSLFPRIVKTVLTLTFGYTILYGIIHTPIDPTRPDPHVLCCRGRLMSSLCRSVGRSVGRYRPIFGAT